MLLNPVALAASAGLRTGSSPGLFRECMEGAALCKALKALGEGLPCPSAESQDARSCVCLRFPGSHARSACSPPQAAFYGFWKPTEQEADGSYPGESLARGG